MSPNKKKQRVKTYNHEGEIQRLKEALERKEKEVSKLRKRLEENSSIERLIKGLQEQAERQITALREELLQEIKELRKRTSEWKNKRTQLQQENISPHATKFTRQSLLPTFAVPTHAET